MAVDEQHPPASGYTDDARHLAEKVLGHRMTACTCGNDDAAAAHIECGDCQRVAWQLDRAVWGKATEVGCEHSELGRAFNEQYGPRP